MSRGAELIRRGLECGRRNELERGVLFLVDGLEHVDERIDPRLALSAYHNLALYFVHLGLTAISRGVVMRARRLYRQVDDPVMDARLAWLQGTIARVSGNLELAVKKLRQASEIFVELDQKSEEVQVLEDLEEVEQLQAALNSPKP